MSDIQIIANGEAKTVEKGTKAWQLFADTPEIIAARVGGELKDLAHELGEGDTVEGVAIGSKDGRDILRHSTAHVMAQAVQELFPQAKLGIGPPITDGFYYDFDVAEPFVPEDLVKIESRMRKIVKEGQKFDRREISDDDARTELADEPYKLELIGLKSKAGDAAEGANVEVGEGGLTIYDNLKRDGSVAWGDLCRGPHLPTTKRIPAFTLMRSAAAYWRGDEKNKQLQRIYGTAWETKEALEEHLFRIEEAQRRDHRRLGTELDLFSFPDEIGSGLPVFHPKGGVIKREMEDYVRRRHIEEGFEYVGTPHIAKEGLFYTSGHLPYYGEGMFPALDVDGQEYRLKAMNCPMHNLIFRSRQRSYRELPLRFFEFGHVYRNEKSGVIHGLTRVRGFAQDDSHSYVTPEQAPDEIRHLLKFVLSLLRDFGLDDFYLELSTRDDSKPDKFIGSDEDWANATKVLEDVCLETGLELVPDPGGAAYYGPKVSVQARDAIGRTWQMSTIQYDFNMPSAERFNLEYVAADGTRQQPVMIHSAKFGSIERFMGVLVEHYAG
ncbi:MAG: threonine--tRNA ligase, partial [Aeromicrobium sp.]|nr:threonine--tRNA ligase [Aeromicrobium sp.]